MEFIKEYGWRKEEGGRKWRKGRLLLQSVGRSVLGVGGRICRKYGNDDDDDDGEGRER
jgi:hypothetical protein